MRKRYVVKLDREERSRLTDMVNHGRVAAYKRRHAQALLLVDEGEYGPGLIDRDAARQTGFRRRTIEMIRERCVIEGLDSALERRKRNREKSRRLDGEGEAQLITLACSEAPRGCARWTLHMLADKLVELEIVDTISHESVRQVLKKHHKTLEDEDVVHCGGK